MCVQVSPSESKWCSRFFVCFSGSGICEKRYHPQNIFHNFSNPSPIQSELMRGFLTVSGWVKKGTVSAILDVPIPRVSFDWVGKGFGQLRNPFFGWYLFSQIPEHKKTVHNFSQTYSGVRLPNLCFSKELNHQKRFQEEPLGVSVFLALCFWGLEASQLIEGTFGIWRNLSSSASTRH